MKVLPGRQKQLEKLVARLGLPPTAPVQWPLLELALTHPSVSATDNYEQLEFVGDAVLRLFVAEQFWHHDPKGTVGQWTAVRSVLVSDQTLADIAKAFGLERFLAVAPTTIGDPRGEASYLADALEATMGALYLSTHNFVLIEPWLKPELEQRAAQVRSDPAYQNYKAALQEWTQNRYHQLPEYRVAAVPNAQTSQPHFRAEVWLLGQSLGTGQGASRKAAEKAAAKVAYLQLTSETDQLKSPLMLRSQFSDA